MRKKRILSIITFCIGILMISIGFVLQNDETVFLNRNDSGFYNTNNIAISTNALVKKSSSNISPYRDMTISDIVMEVTPASIIVPPRVEVYEGMTIEELADKLNRNLGGILSGHGDIIASHSLEMGVDPYLAAAVMIHETGNGTSRIANNCYNFGGQKGSGCGMYKKYETIEEGICGIIDNLYRNYYAYNLNTVESIAHKYAESADWPNKINYFIRKIRDN